MSNTPGTFQNHGSDLEFVALTRAADVAGIAAHEVTNAISNGHLQVHEVSGCKCVVLFDLIRLKQEASQ